MIIGLWVILLFAGPFISIPQDQLPRNVWKPPELTAGDPEIRKLLDQTTSRCGQPDSGENIHNINKALEIADTRGLLGDKALAEAYLGSAYVGRAEMELVFTNFQKALQDALETKNKVLEADILVSLASEAQLKGNVPRAIELTSKALDISEKSGSLYEKARALGELGRLKLLMGKTDEAVQSIDEALKIDKLNGYRFLALHLVYRGYYLGLTKKPDEAIETLAEAKRKALALNDAYSFIMAENSYAFGLVQRGRTDEAITELELIKQGDLQRVIQDSKEQMCFGAAFGLPILHLTLLEGLTNVLEAANQTSKELEVWTEALSYSHAHGIGFGEAEAAQKAGNLDSQLKNNDEALKYYAIAADLYRNLQNEPLHAQVQVSQALLLIKLGRGKEAALLEQDIAAYAKRHNLRWPEFTAYGVLAEIYQPVGDLEAARDALEKALSLVRPGPFDEEIDNRTVLQDYLRLADVYRGLRIPTRELVAIDEAFFVAVHLKDEKVQGNLVGYLDQRLKDLGIRELVSQRQKEGQLAESLLYACILFTRDGMPKAGQDNSNWNRVINLPFLMTQTPEGARALSQILDQADSFLGWERVGMADALSRYYITSGNDSILAEKYALRGQEIAKGSPGDMTSFRAQRACVLAIAYSRQFKNSLAKSELSECSTLAKEANDEQSLKFAAIANALIQIATGEAAFARDSLEQLLAKVPNDPELQVEFAMSLANARYYDKAGSQLDLAVARFASKGDGKAAAGAYVRVASALNSDNSAKAQELQLQYLRSGQHMYQELKAQAEEAAALTALGEYYLRLSKVETAIEQLNKAFDLAQNANRNDILAQTLSDLGNASQAQKDFKRARDFHKRAAAVYRELKNPGLEAFCLQNLGRDYAAMNEPEEGLSSFLEAKKAAALGPALTQYFVNLPLGEFYREMGQFEKSLTIFRESVEITSQAGDIEHCAYSHLAIAELDTLIGSWGDAVVESEAALKLFQDIGDRGGQAACWVDLTGIYSGRSSSLKDFNKAEECYAKAKELGYGENLQLVLVEVYLQTGKYDEAASIANESLKACQRVGNTDCQANGLLSLSEAKRLSGDTNAARAALNQARPLASKSLDLYLRGRLLYGEARQLNAEHKLNEALAVYRQLITLIETVKGRLGASGQREFSENYGYIYDELVSLLSSMSNRDSHDRLKFASESLEYAERNKARQFAESWGRTFVDQMRRSLPIGVQETERSLFSKRDRILAQLNTSTLSGEPFDKTQKESSEADLAAVQKQIANFFQELRRTSPQYAAVAYPEAIQIGTLPLRKGETFVEFKMTDDSTFAWIVQNRNGSGNELVSFYEIAWPRAWFLNRISLLRNALNSGRPDTVDWKISEEVFAALFPGEASAVITQSQDVIFIPDDVLFALPFELFSPNASKGDFIFLKKASTYYPSAVSFRLGRTAIHESKWQEAFLGLADPITSDEDDRFEAVKAVAAGTPQSADGNSGSRESPFAEAEIPKDRGLSFERLQGTKEEVQRIAVLLRATNEKVEVRMGVDATKGQFLDTDLSKFQFLHFATHGVLTVDANIKEPALVLSFDGVARSHMFLTMSEVLGLKLRSDSVVLSACNTGSGSISKAEGVMSLGRAFLAAGSSSVTVSLWQVSDESTAVLMEEYYRGLLKNEKKSVALAEARNAVFSKGFKNPFFWAPFILIGE